MSIVNCDCDNVNLLRLNVRHYLSTDVFQWPTMVRIYFACNPLSATMANEKKIGIYSYEATRIAPGILFSNHLFPCSASILFGFPVFLYNVDSVPSHRGCEVVTYRLNGGWGGKRRTQWVTVVIIDGWLYY